MDKYTMETLKTTLCRELDEIARRGINSHQELDITKDLLEALKHLEDIEMNSMNSSLLMEGEGTYSQRGNNYSQRNNYNYYNRSVPRNIMNDGNSYKMYNTSMEEPRYSRLSNKEEAIQELHHMIQNTSDEEVKQTILDCISKMEK